MAKTSVDTENLFHPSRTWRQHPAGKCCGHPWAGQGEGAIVLEWYLWKRGGEKGEEEGKMKGCMVLFGEGGNEATELTYRGNKQSGVSLQPEAVRDFSELNYRTISISFHFEMESRSLFIKNVHSIKYGSAAGPSGEQ